MNKHKIFIDSALWDCGENLIGCSKIFRYLSINGHEIVDNPIDAEYIIINSCGAVQDLINNFLELFNKYHSIKKKNSTIIIFGCLVKINKKLVDSLDGYPISFEETSKLDDIFYSNVKYNLIQPYCDDKTRKQLIFGKKINLSKMNIDGDIKKYIVGNHSFFLAILLSNFSKKLRNNFNILNSAHSNKIFVEIGQGCTGNCSFCVIKKAKGGLRSRKPSEIIENIKMIYDKKKELNLIADDCGCYGVDIGTTLPELINLIHNKFPNLKININYFNPNYLEKYADRIVGLFKNCQIVRVQIPMQSGSNKILNLMNRKYNTKKVIKIVDQIRKTSPETIIYSHFIVGFPGENTKDFIKTLSVANHFNFPIAFGYSDMKGAKSSTLPNKKSNFTIFSRRVIATIIFNIIVLLKLLTTPTTNENN